MKGAQGKDCNSCCLRERPMRTPLKSRLLVLGLLLPGLGVAGSFNVTTHHYDNLRTGWNPQETTLTASNVTQNSFGVIATTFVDAQVDAQPLVLTSSFQTISSHPVVYVATENNSVYAIDGESGAELAMQHFEAAVAIGSVSTISGCKNNTSLMG